MKGHKFSMSFGIYHLEMEKEDDNLYICIEHRKTVSYQHRAVVEKENVTLAFIS